jgi:hypothetical protein
MKKDEIDMEGKGCFCVLCLGCVRYQAERLRCTLAVGPAG